jgi:hypothetical protein
VFSIGTVADASSKGSPEMLLGDDGLAIFAEFDKTGDVWLCVVVVA